MTPEQLNQQMQVAVQMHQQGDFVTAESLYREALNFYPQHADILNLLGTLCSQDNRLQQGEDYIKQALNIQPEHPHYMLNLGQTQVKLGLINDAIVNFRAVLNTQKNSAVTHFNLANCYKQDGQLSLALQHYEKAVLLDSKKAGYYYNFANTLQAAGKYKSAIDVYQQSLLVNPSNAHTHNNIGVVLNEWEKDEEAKKHFQKAIQLKPDFVDALHNLFQYYETNNEVEAAEKQLLAIEKILPDDTHVKLKKLLLFPIVLQNSSEIPVLAENLLQEIKMLNTKNLNIKDIIRYDLSFPSIATYYGMDDCKLRSEFSSLFNDIITPLPALPEKKPGQQPNIAFIVTRGHEGVFLKCMAGLIQQLPDTISVTIVCSLPNGKTILEKKLPEQQYVEINNDIEEAASEIHRTTFDVLYYREVGTDSMNYFLPFFKPAKIQVGFWGWPVTSGIEAMDYYLSSAFLEPENADKNYSEKLIKLARLPVYYYRPPVPEENKQKFDFGFDNDCSLYLCAQNLRKVHPDMDDVFKQILHANKKSVILLIDDKRKNITENLKTRLKKNLGDLFLRLQFIPRMAAEDYLSLVKMVDVILDTFHYTGGANTNYDAFAAGTPVVTLVTQFHRGRYTYAAYKQMAYLECVAKNEADYVRIALALTTDKDFQQRARQAVMKGCEHLLEDQQAVDAFVENVFELC